MSIPKEPRQLMINIMYIVLTAILALNVSAEILNAFLTMNESISESSQIVGASNNSLMNAISDQADAYKQFKPFQEKAAQAQEISKKFYAYVEELKELTITESGGFDEDNKLVGLKDKDVTTRLFVDENRGEELETKIIETRERLLELIEEDEARETVAANIPLNIKPIPEDSDKENWAQFTFSQMPVAAILPMLSKFQNDVRVAETALLNYYANKISVKPTHDEYDAIVSADKSYVIKGEELSAEIFLGAYSSTTNSVSVSVDGRSYPVRNGKALFTTTANDVGTKEMDVVVSVKNPLTGERKSYRKKFTYEVGERSVAISADKMNVFYVGVDNPLSLSVAGVPSSKVNVDAQGVTLQKVRNGKYNVKPTKIGDAKITVSGGGLAPTTYQYRVKKIPTPIVKLGNSIGGSMKAAEFKIHKGVYPHLENFDFEATCNVVGFELTRLPKKDDPQFAKNNGGKYGAEAQRLVQRAQPGDIYYFDKIKVRCPGDVNSRKINGLVFNIR